MNEATVKHDLARRLEENGFPQDGIYTALHNRQKFLGNKTPVEVVVTAPAMAATVVAMMCDAGAVCLHPTAKALTL